MQGDGTAGLVVTDAGAGIDPRTRGRVFARFYTGDSVSGSGGRDAGGPTEVVT
jgi:signal transduction histidine kinase